MGKKVTDCPIDCQTASARGDWEPCRHCELRIDSNYNQGQVWRWNNEDNEDNEDNKVDAS